MPRNLPGLSNLPNPLDLSSRPPSQTNPPRREAFGSRPLQEECGMMNQARPRPCPLSVPLYRRQLEKETSA